MCLSKTHSRRLIFSLVLAATFYNAEAAFLIYPLSFIGESKPFQQFDGLEN